MSKHNGLVMYGPTQLRKGKKLLNQFRYEILDLSNTDDPDGEWLGQVTVASKDLAERLADQMGWTIES